MEKIAIALINHKGGVGKTTLAIILSQIALNAGMKVAAVDLDPQKNFTDGMSFVQERYGEKLHLTDAITDDADVIILDCPPALGDATVQAIKFSDITLVPVHSDIFSMSNLGVVYEFGESYGKAFRQMAVVKIGFANKLKGLTEIASKALLSRQYPVAGEISLNRLIPYNIALGRVWSSGIPVPARKPYIDLYKTVRKSYSEMLGGNFATAWEADGNAGA